MGVKEILKSVGIETEYLEAFLVDSLDIQKEVHDATKEVKTHDVYSKKMGIIQAERLLTFLREHEPQH